MRSIGFALLLLAATATAQAYADTLPLTVTGTEYFTLEGPSGGSFDTAPPLTTNAEVYGVPETETFPLDADGTYFTGAYPEISVTFDYNPDGLSSGIFYFESDNNNGYLDPSGNFYPGVNFMIASGTLTQAVTPEPSTMTLLGTGLLIVAGRLRRRLRD